MSQPIHVPDKFNIIYPNLYRSSLPTVQNLAYLKTLNLSTIIYLSCETIQKHLKLYIESNNIKLYHLGYKYYNINNWSSISEELIKEAIQLILDSSLYPLIIMCSNGIHETGTVVAIIRKLQYWNFTSIIAEYRLYSGNKARVTNEVFIERFDIDLLCFPKNLAAWRVDDLKFLEEMKIKQANYKKIDDKVSIQDYYNASKVPLISCNSEFSKKKTLIDDEDD